MKAIDDDNNFSEYQETLLFRQLFLLDDVLLQVDIKVGIWTQVVRREAVQYQIESCNNIACQDDGTIACFLFFISQVLM